MSQELMQALFQRDLSAAEMAQIAEAIKADPVAAEQLAAYAQAHYQGLGLKPARLVGRMAWKLWSAVGVGVVLSALSTVAIKQALVRSVNDAPVAPIQAPAEPVVASPAGPTSSQSPPTAVIEGDRMSVEVTLPRAMAVQVDLFDAQGRRLRHLFAGTAPKGANRFEVDGKDKYGQPLAAGRYRVTVDYGGGQLEKWFELK